MDFLDAEAVESEDDEELTDLEKKRAKRLKAMESDDEEDEDDEERLQEELQDLIDDNPIEEDDDHSDAGSDSKRKRSDDEDFDDRLEDEDYDLIEENLGVKVERRKRFRRLRQFDDEEEEERDGEVHDRDQSSELYDEDRDDERSRSYADNEEEREEYSDEDDFIVDDDGRPITDRRRKKKHIFTDAALQEAQDIFGVDFDYEDFEKYDEGYDEEEEEEEEDDEYLDEELGEDALRRSKKKKVSRKKTNRKSIFEIYEPSELKRGHFTDVDNQIRINDIPERMQLRDVPVTLVPDDSDELAEEAKWIYEQAFCTPTVSTQECKGGVDPRTMTKKGPQTIGKIKKALDFMRNQHFEVPFIAFYRKEYIYPELDIMDLWKIYSYDGKWCQLKSRKAALQTLFENMREYQTAELTKDLNAPLPESVRMISDEDINKLKEVKTTEELKDVHNNFLLHYGHMVYEMYEKKRAEEREAARLERKQARRKRVNVEDDEESVIENDDEEELDKEPEKEVLDGDTVVKPAVRSGPYTMCRKAGIGGFAKRFGLKPEQFAENVRDNYQRHDVEQEGVSPYEIAKEYIGGTFKTAEDVVKAGKYVVATQLSKEPLLRKVIREAFFERGRLNVVPTKKGIKEIDENHPLYSMKYLKSKPVRDLMGVDFLRLHAAQDDKLITMKFDEDIDGLTRSSYLEEIKQLYVRDEFSNVVQEWNSLRLDCVEVAYRKMLYPDIIKELRNQLLLEAKESVINACAMHLRDWLKIAPYNVDFEDDDEDWDVSKGIRVMGIAYVHDFEQAAFACLVAPDGECTDHLRLPHLLKRKSAFRPSDSALKQADLNAIKNFVVAKRPHVICISGESRDALVIADEIKSIVKMLIDEEQFPEIPVEILDNNLAKVYANSIKGENDFRDYPILLRQAISLARRVQDPLVEFSQLCTSDDEILCLRYHPLQDYISSEDLLDAITKEFVNRVNEVGVDINEAVQSPYSGNLLQFVCGLGPRKAAALTKLLKQTNQRLENRTQLVTLCHMGPKIFINCAGFIKIDTNSLGDSTEAYVEVLDGSRVHPETYEWARKMAVDALEYDDEETNPAGALEEILETPERLKDLDLDAFAEELERQGFGNKSITLYDIRAELNCRYKDMRVSHKSPNSEELFDLLTKETPESFYVGKMVLATVFGICRRKPKTEQLDQANPVRMDTGLWQCPFCLKCDFPELSEVWNHFDAGQCPGQPIGVKVRLDNGVTGYIQLKNLSDKEVTNPEERVRIGQLIHCRIVKIDVQRFVIEATCKTSDLNDTNNTWKPMKDQYYDYDMEMADKKREEGKKKIRSSQTYVKRVIVHPAFHNISFSQALKLMANMDQGEAIIRPSSKGTDHLTVTWKVTENIHQHIDVVEKKKANAFSLGQSLWIDNEEFEDLDEIIARHINPMASHARDLLTFRYYKDTDGGVLEKAEAHLRSENAKNPNKIHYIVSASAKYPGKFLLAYFIKNRCRYEYITITPDGYRFRRQVFETIGMLFKWFKEHYRDPFPQYTPASNTPLSTRSTPYNPQGTGITPRINSMTPHHTQTPHFQSALTPGGYGVGYPAATPYTPSGQTPFMTPFPQTPHHTTTPHHFQIPQRTVHHAQTPLPSQTPRQTPYQQPAATPRQTPYQQPLATPRQTPYHQPATPRQTPYHQPATPRQTPYHQPVTPHPPQTPHHIPITQQPAMYAQPYVMPQPFLHPATVIPVPKTPKSRPNSSPAKTLPAPSNPADWGKIAEEWAKKKQKENRY